MHRHCAARRITETMRARVWFSLTVALEIKAGSVPARTSNLPHTVNSHRSSGAAGTPQKGFPRLNCGTIARSSVTYCRDLSSCKGVSETLYCCARAEITAATARPERVETKLRHTGCSVCPREARKSLAKPKRAVAQDVQRVRIATQYRKKTYGDCLYTRAIAPTLQLFRGVCRGL